ncbi:hypothetical protein [Ornithinimicrobium kibberense]
MVWMIPGSWRWKAPAASWTVITRGGGLPAGGGSTTSSCGST